MEAVPAEFVRLHEIFGKRIIRRSGRKRSVESRVENGDDGKVTKDLLRSFDRFDVA